MFSKFTGSGKGGTPKAGYNISGNRGKSGFRKTKEKKAKMICDYCKETGHEIHICFKIHGYPNWYKKMKEERGKHVANMADAGNIQGNKGVVAEEVKGAQFEDTSILIQQEIAKYMAGKLMPSSGKGDATLNFAHLAEFGGNEVETSNFYAFTLLENLESGIWILDTGASRHICTDLNLMANLIAVTSQISIHLPDGTFRAVTHMGDVKLN